MTRSESSSEPARLLNKTGDLLKNKLANPGLSISGDEFLVLLREIESYLEKVRSRDEESINIPGQDQAAYERYLDYFESARSGHYVINRESIVIDANPFGCKLLGAECSEFIGREFRDFLSADTKPVFDLFLPELFLNKAEQSCHVSLRVDHIHAIHVRISGKILKDNDLCFLTVVDISEYKRSENLILEGVQQIKLITELRMAEDKIRKMDLQYKALTEKSPDGIALLDKEGSFKYVSPTAKKMFGYDPSDEININPADITHPEDLPMVLSELAKLLGEPDYTATLQYRCVDRSGGWKWIESTFSNLLSDPNVESIVINFRDITDRKLVLEELQENEKNFQAVFKNNSSALVIIEEDMTISMVNDAFCRMSGYPEDEVTGRNWRQIISSGDIERFMGDDVWRSGKVGNVADTAEFSLYHKNGEIRDTRMSVAMIPGSGKIITSFVDVTDHKKATAALHAIEGRFRGLFENIFEGYAFCQLVYLEDRPVDWIYLEVNRAFGKLTGLKNVEGKRASLVIPGIQETDPGLISIYSRVSRTGIPEKFEIFVGSLDDWFSITVYSEEKGFFIAVFDVITERKRSEELIMSTSRRLELALNVAQAGTWDWNVVTGQIKWSPQMFEIFGIDQDTSPASFESWRKALHPGDAVEAENRITKALQQKTILDQDYRILTPDNQVRWINATGTGIYNELGEPVEMIGICQDITERRQIENFLRESEEKYRTLIEISQDALYINVGNAITYLNPAAVRLFGAETADQIIGRSPFEIIHPDFHPAILKRINDLTARGIEATPMEEKIVRIDGATVDVEVTATPFKMKGQPAIQVVLRDITERKKTDQKIQYQMEELRLWSEVTLGREDRNRQLKTEVNELLMRLGDEIRYPSQENNGTRFPAEDA